MCGGQTVEGQVGVYDVVKGGHSIHRACGKGPRATLGVYFTSGCAQRNYTWFAG